ncbi:MAG: hypothetical protein AAGC74_12760, partial [Verrucomicrobiota bacterium]
PDELHVVPAGMCESLYSESSLEAQYSDEIMSVLLKEFSEELFENKELERAHHIKNPDSIRGKISGAVNRSLKNFKFLDKDEPKPCDLEIHPTGIAFDLTNLRPEICALILIRPKETTFKGKTPDDVADHLQEIREHKGDSQEWVKDFTQFEGNWETTNLDPRENFAGKVDYNLMPPEESVQAGAACYILGSERLLKRSLQ